MEKKELTDALELHAKGIEEKVAELKAAQEKQLTEKAEALETELKEAKEKGVKMQEQLDAMDIKMQKGMKNAKDANPLSFEGAVKELFESAEYKEALGKKGGLRDREFEIKADTSDITGDHGRTMNNTDVKFAPDRQLAFIPNITGGTIGQDKNRLTWMDGTYTSNFGYAAENVAHATGDAGTAKESHREMSKLSAFLVLTKEMMTDFSYVASKFRMQMRDKAMVGTDLLAYNGDGDNTTNPDHIYGILGHATAFNAATTGLTGANGIVAPNIKSLVRAVKLQASKSEFRGQNIIWMNDTDLLRLKETKDTTGQYIFDQRDGLETTIEGMKVVGSNAVTANTMTVGDSSKIQMWWKRRPEFLFTQNNGTDIAQDRYTAFMFLRAQVLVEDVDKPSLIHVADINASITAITKA